MRKVLYLASLVFAGTLSLTAPASALPLVNGGFETGDFTGWTVTGDGNTFVAGSPHSGTFAAWLGNIGCCGTLSQTIATTAGQTLTLTYWLQASGSTPNYFDATWNGVIIPGSVLTNTAGFGYTLFSFNLLATGSDTLLFDSEDDPSWWQFDDISLDVASVPEPATLALFGAGLIGFGVIRRRRKSKV